VAVPGVNFANRKSAWRFVLKWRAPDGARRVAPDLQFEDPTISSRLERACRQTTRRIGDRAVAWDGAGRGATISLGAALLVWSVLLLLLAVAVFLGEAHFASLSFCYNGDAGRRQH